MIQPLTTNHQSQIILAIDTATAALVVGIGTDSKGTSLLSRGHPSEGGMSPSGTIKEGDTPSKARDVPVVLASYFAVVDRKHLELSTVIIDELMKKAGIKLADLTAIIVGLGPGSLIGARVGVVIAKTLAQVLKVPLIGISTLDVVADLYPTPEALIQLGIDRLRKKQFNSIYELEPIYLRGPV